MIQVRWKTIESLFHEALALPKDELAPFLENIRQRDNSLYLDLCSLLNHHSFGRPFLNLGELFRMAHLRAFDPGDQVGSYRILELLGEGGMGEVYLAQDTRLERKVALKTLRLDLQDDAAGVDRLWREAKAASALNHPNIVTVYECGEHEGITYIACEYIDGQPLREFINQLPRKKILDYARQIGLALQAAHTVGIVHRDIKPENVMVRRDGYIKVVDFGVAKLVNAKLEGAEDPHKKLTSGTLDSATGPMFGTLNYMSPEQAIGRSVDQRTDIWSWGVMLYEMLSRRRPFDALDKGEILVNILDKKPAAPCKNRRLNQLVAKALAKKPEERFQTMAEVLRELGRLQLALYRRFAAITMALAMIIIVALLVVPPRPRSVHPAAVSVLASEKVIHGAISPDGNYAYVRESEEGQTLRIGQVGTIRDKERIPASRDQYQGVTFSPDGRFIYCVVKRDKQQPGMLLRVPTMGSAGPEVVANDIDYPISLSPDGSQFSFVRYDPVAEETSIIVRSINKNRESRLSTRKMPEGFWPNTLWSLDGKFVIGGVFNSAQKGMETTRIISIRLRDLQEKMGPAQSWSWMGWLAWIQDGRSLAVTAREHGNGPQIMQVTWPEGKAMPRPITNEPRQTYRDLESDAGLSRISALRTVRNANIWIAGLNDIDKPTQLAQGDYFGLTWTGSGDIVSQTDAGGQPDLWLIDSHSGTHHQFTNDTAVEESPVATPDGLYVVYASNQGGTIHLWRSRPDGSDPILLTSGRFNDRYPAISPDSKWVFFTSSRTGHDAIWKVSIQGGEPLPVTTAGRALRSSLSPDGTMMVCQYSSSPADPPAYSVLETATGHYLRSLPGISLETVVRWSADGKGLMYVVEQKGVSNLWVKSLQGGEVRQLTHYGVGRILTFALSPDKKSLAFIRGDDNSELVLMRLAE